MEALAKTGKPVILCLIAGSAIDLTYADRNFDAVLQCWYPGARGGKALAEILFGDVSPSGKLCVTFYHNEDKLPDFKDYSMKGRTYRYLEQKPLYPFGYGLTYGDVETVSADISADGLSVTARLVNHSSVAAGEVGQGYVDCFESTDRPLHPRLCGFARTVVPADGEAEVVIRLDEETCTVVNSEGERISGGDHFRLYVGTSQPDERSFELTGKRPVILDWSRC